MFKRDKRKEKDKQKNKKKKQKEKRKGLLSRFHVEATSHASVDGIIAIWRKEVCDVI